MIARTKDSHLRKRRQQSACAGLARAALVVRSIPRWCLPSRFASARGAAIERRALKSPPSDGRERARHQPRSFAAALSAALAPCERHRQDETPKRLGAANPHRRSSRNRARCGLARRRPMLPITFRTDYLTVTSPVATTRSTSKCCQSGKQEQEATEDQART
jgi:hypothetical protein